MATTCPIGFDAARLREQVTRTYERVAAEPASGFHFNVGARYAIEVLGYAREDVESLPATSTSRFAGVGNPHCVGTMRPGAVVLDHACGAGMDLLLAARRIGARGRAIGVVEMRAGAFEDLPVADASVDYVLSNGVVNLAPDKPRVFAEIARVLRPGGELYLADVIIEREIPGVGSQPPEEYCGIAQTSKNVLAELAPRVQWLETYVANDKVYCVFLAESAEVIREHARRTGFPADRIEVVRGMIHPTYAPN